MKIGIVGPRSTIYRYLNNTMPKEWQIIECDKSEYVFKLFQCDIIINFAAYTDVAQSDYNKMECWKSNVDLVRDLIKVGAIYHIPILHLSTLYVSNVVHCDQKMASNWHGFKSYYSLTKYIAEQLLFLDDFSNWGIIRTDSVFGANLLGQDDKFVGKMIKYQKDGAIPNLIKVSGIRPSYAKDVAEYILQLLNYFESGMIKFDQDVFQATNSIEEGEIVTLEAYFNEVANILDRPNEYKAADEQPRYFMPNFVNSGLRHWKDALRDYIKNELKA